MARFTLKRCFPSRTRHQGHMWGFACLEGEWLFLHNFFHFLIIWLMRFGEKFMRVGANSCDFVGVSKKQRNFNGL